MLIIMHQIIDAVSVGIIFVSLNGNYDLLVDLQ